MDIAKSQRNASNKQTSLNGRMLCHETGWTTHDGMVIAETMGFFDESDVPPIDTWFYFDENYRDNPERALLFCWIPSKFEEVVQKGMDAEMFESNKWLDQINPTLNGRSRQLVANM